MRSAGGGQHRRLPKAPSGDSGPAEQGISKIKASLRQTKRLLAKENLAPDVRQEAERRLISLEQDLETRQSSEHDRKNAERYHKVRFFERQKLVRLIKKIKKTADGESKAVKADLREKRVLLNYVLVSKATDMPTKDDQLYISGISLVLPDFMGINVTIQTSF